MNVKLGSEPGSNGMAALTLLIGLLDVMREKGVLTDDDIKNAAFAAEKQLRGDNSQRAREARGILADIS